MISIFLIKNSDPIIYNIERHIAYNNIGTIKERLELELNSFELSSVSLYIYDTHSDAKSALLSAIPSDLFNVVILDNNNKIFGGYIDNSTIVYDVKNQLISFNVYSYRFILKSISAEDVYDYMYQDTDGNNNKVWHAFKSVGSLAKLIYEEAGQSYVPEYKIGNMIHVANLLDNDYNYFTFFDKSNMPFRNQQIKGIMPSPDGDDKFCIFTDGFIYKGTPHEGWIRKNDTWSTGGGVVHRVANWKSQRLSSVTQPFAQRVPWNIGQDVHWYHSAVSYENNREMAVGVKSGSDPWSDIYIATRTYSGGSWGAWSVRNEGNISGWESPVMIPNFALDYNTDNNKWYLIFRLVNGRVIVVRFDADTTFSRYYQTNEGYMDVAESPEDGVAGQHREKCHDAKLFLMDNETGMYKVIYRQDTGEIVIWHVEQYGQPTFSKHNINDIQDGLLWNLKSYDHQRRCILMDNNHNIKVGYGVPFTGFGFSLTNLSSLYQLDWGSDKTSDPVDYNPVEICFSGWQADQEEEHNWSFGGGRGFFGSGNNDYYTKFQSIFVGSFDGFLVKYMVALNFNRFGGGWQFAYSGKHGEAVIPQANFEDKTCSDVLVDLAKTSCALEYMDKNSIAHFYLRNNIFKDIYHFNVGNSTNHNYAILDDDEQEDLDFDSNDSFTIEMFVTQTDAVQGCICGKINTSLSTFWKIQTTTSYQVRAYIADTGAGNQTTTPGGDISISNRRYGTYIALVVNRSNNTMRMWVNNGWASDAADISGVGSLVNNGPFIIGKHPQGAPTQFLWKGNIREIRITKRALSNTQLLAQSQIVNGWETEALTVAHWDFNLQNGRDKSPKNNILNFYHATYPGETMFLKKEHSLLEDLSNFKESQSQQQYWENYFERIVINYEGGGQYVYGSTDFSAKTLEVDVNNIYNDLQARLIARTYYNIFNKVRLKQILRLMTIYPELFSKYKINGKNYLCIETNKNYGNMSSESYFVEIDK